jgi:hypothetical protein
MQLSDMQVLLVTSAASVVVASTLTLLLKRPGVAFALSLPFSLLLGVLIDGASRGEVSNLWPFACIVYLLPMLATTGIGVAIGWAIIIARYDPLACPRCGYSLRGNVSGRCPECGRPVPPPQREEERGSSSEARKQAHQDN